VGQEPGRLQQQHHGHGLHHDQAQLRAAGGAAEGARRARAADAEDAGGGPEEPGQPAAIYTDIAIQQMDGNIGFFAQVVPSAFTDVKDPALLADFKASNQAVVDALTRYKTFLQKDLKPRSKGTYAIGA
jgi:hypothetical protein